MPQKPNLFWQFQVMFHLYQYIGRDDDDGCNDGESSVEDYFE